MKSKWTVVVIIMILIIIGCWTKFFYDVKAEIRRRDPKVMAQEIENALNEVKSGWEKKAVTVDQPVTFMDDEGNTIVYHWLGKPPAMPVEVPRKKALASSIERSELLT